MRTRRLELDPQTTPQVTDVARRWGSIRLCNEDEGTLVGAECLNQQWLVGSFFGQAGESRDSAALRMLHMLPSTGPENKIPSTQDCVARFVYFNEDGIK